MALSAVLNTNYHRAYRSVALALVLSLPAWPAVVDAQDPDADEATVDEIVVIGTHIPQADPDGPSPVTILDRDALERTGATTVARALERLPFGNNGSFNDSDALSSAIGGTGISFRGLGANAVLVLINGRRVTPYGFSFQADTLVSFVDLNSIPIGAVEQIEILKDGASAIYGSDAIAGVINIVLKEDVSGLELEGRIGKTADSGAEEVAINALWGHVGTRTSAELIATYSKREQLFWRDREISRSSDFREFGGFDLRAGESATFNVNSTWAAYGAECEERGGTFSGIQDFELLEDGDCVYDPNPAIAEPSIERVGLMSIVNHDLRDNLTLHIEASYQDTEIVNQTFPELFIGDYFPINNPWNPFPPSAFDTDPFGSPTLPFAYAFVETGPAIDRVNTETIRAVVSLEGVFSSWVWEIGALYNSAVSSRHGEKGYLSAESIEAALNGIDLDGDGTSQPNEFLNVYSSASNPNSQALTDTLQTSIFRESETVLFSLDGLISGKLMVLPSGNLSGALGFEYRDDSLHDVSDQLSLGDQLANQFAPLFFGIRYDNAEDIVPLSFQVQELDESFSPTATGGRTQLSLFGELQIPILENLEVQAALRYEDYSDFGTELNPRVAVRFQPWSRLTLRGSWGRSFRAPSLAELYLSPSAEMFAAWDPMRCPEPDLVLPPFVACTLESFEYVTSGNSELKPERSESVSLGFTADVWKALSITANFWSIEHKDKIVAPGIDQILDKEQSLGPAFVERNTALPEDIALGFPGNIERVNNLFINLAKHDVSGIDVDATFDLEVAGIGSLNSRLLWTNLESSKFAFNATDPLQEIAGTYGHPKNRASLDTYLSTENWQFGVYGRWTDGYEDPNL
ncbi:MAG: TonB-dependent receptor, partial [Bacteroidetes bacterium]|nr:TonB-dependent receptor [Bacteroidota bacterium]